MARMKVCKCGKTLLYNETCSCSSRKEYMKKYQNEHKEIEDALRSSLWLKKKKFIKQRDNYMCQRCFIKYNIINTEDLQVHHIKPRIKYPQLMYEDSNLICVCGTCNRQIGTKEHLDFEWKPNENNDIIL